MTPQRKKLFAHVRKKYGVSPEYLWMRYPEYAAFRHGDNRKWFALVMNVPENRLGLPGDEIVDILNVKLKDPLLIDLLVQQPGYYRGYHFGKGNWVSIRLDGTVDFREITRWLAESYLVTASPATKKRLRPPKEWIVPANPKYYDVEAALRASEEIDWKQGKGVKAGDTVYLYVAAPVSAILYRFQVTETDIPYRFADGNVRMDHLMKLKLLRRYPPEQFTFERLGKEFGIFAVRGPRGIPQRLSRALK